MEWSHSPGGLHMRIWLSHCTSGCRAGGGLLAGTEVALAERPVMPATGGEGGGEGDGEVGEPHCVW